MIQTENETEAAKAAKVTDLIEGLAEDLRATVTEIEGSIATTQFHYGDYMALLWEVGDGNPVLTKLVAIALLRAGANADGVRWAVRLTVG